MKTYAEKLKDPRWQKKRLEILKRDKFKCQCCLSKNKMLHIHHKNYLSNSEPWEIPGKYLITLCFECHRKEKLIDFKNLWKRRLKLRVIKKCEYIPDSIIEILFKLFSLKHI